MGTRYNILGLLRSPSSVYVIFRYGTYIVQFLNSILLAKALGDIKYGIYSFVFLIMQYMSYSNLGINESLNTEYAVSKDGDRCKIYVMGIEFIDKYFSVHGVCFFNFNSFAI